MSLHVFSQPYHWDYSYHLCSCTRGEVHCEHWHWGEEGPTLSWRKKSPSLVYTLVRVILIQITTLSTKINKKKKMKQPLSGVLSVSPVWRIVGQSPVEHPMPSAGLRNLMRCRSRLKVLIADLYMYCKSTNFGVLLYLANLANCVFSLIFVAPTYVNYVDRTLHRWGDAKFNSCPNHFILRNAKFYSRQNLLIYSMRIFQLLLLLVVLLLLLLLLLLLIGFFVLTLHIQLSTGQKGCISILFTGIDL